MEATGEPAVAVYVHPVDLENLKAWSQENLWYIVNDDSGKWEIDGVPLKTSLSIARGEVRVD